MDMESILSTTKKLAQLSDEYDVYDPDIIMYINSVFLTLKQMGVGPAAGFVISDENSTWNEFIPDNVSLREAVKSYMGAKVRLKFDPPASSVLLEALKNTISEDEWRLSFESETTSTT